MSACNSEQFDSSGKNLSVEKESEETERQLSAKGSEEEGEEPDIEVPAMVSGAFLTCQYVNEAIDELSGSCHIYKDENTKYNKNEITNDFLSNFSINSWQNNAYIPLQGTEYNANLNQDSIEALIEFKISMSKILSKDFFEISLSNLRWSSLNGSYDKESSINSPSTEENLTIEEAEVVLLNEVTINSVLLLNTSRYGEKINIEWQKQSGVTNYHLIYSSNGSSEKTIENINNNFYSLDHSLSNPVNLLIKACNDKGCTDGTSYTTKTWSTSDTDIKFTNGYPYVDGDKLYLQWNDVGPVSYLYEHDTFINGVSDKDSYVTSSQTEKSLTRTINLNADRTVITLTPQNKAGIGNSLWIRWIDGKFEYLTNY